MCITFAVTTTKKSTNSPRRGGHFAWMQKQEERLI
jgi:hypothetical protein